MSDDLEFGKEVEVLPGVMTSSVLKTRPGKVRDKKASQITAVKPLPQLPVFCPKERVVEEHSLL